MVDGHHRKIVAALGLFVFLLGVRAIHASPFGGSVAASLRCEVSSTFTVRPSVDPTQATNSETSVVVPLDATDIGNITVGTNTLVDTDTGKAPGKDPFPGQSWQVVSEARPAASYPPYTTLAADRFILIVGVSGPEGSGAPVGGLPTWRWTVTYSIEGASCPKGAFKAGSGELAAPTERAPVISMLVDKKLYTDSKYAYVLLHCDDAPCSGVVWVDLSAQDSNGTLFGDEQPYVLDAGASDVERVKLSAEQVAALQGAHVIAPGKRALKGNAQATVRGGKGVKQSVKVIIEKPSVYPAVGVVSPTGQLVVSLACRTDVLCAGTLSVVVEYDGGHHTFSAPFTVGPNAAGEIAIDADASLYSAAKVGQQGRVTAEVDDGGSLVDSAGAPTDSDLMKLSPLRR